MKLRWSQSDLETPIASIVSQPCSRSSRCGPLRASSNGCAVRDGRSMNRTNSWSLLPPTSVKLSICHVITVVNRSPGGASVRQSASATGCQDLCHVNAPVGIDEAGVPMFDPNVNRWSNVRKNPTYQGSALAIASWVNAGSESMKTLRGMRAYSSRQNQEPPDRLMNRSAPAQ